MEKPDEQKILLIKEFLLESKLPYIDKAGDLIKFLDSILKTKEESLLKFLQELNEVISKNILNACVLLKNDDQLIKRLLGSYLDFAFFLYNSVNSPFLLKKCIHFIFLQNHYNLIKTKIIYCFFYANYFSYSKNSTLFFTVVGTEKVVKQLRLLLRHLFEVKWASREDFEQVYGRQKLALKKGVDSKGHTKVLKLLNEMIRFSFTKQYEEDGSLFFFTPSSCAITANIKPKSSLHSDFTLIVWLRCMDYREEWKYPTLLRIRYSNYIIECFVREKTLCFRAQENGAPKSMEFAVGTLPWDKWSCLALSLSNSNLLTICGPQVSNTALPPPSVSSSEIEELTFCENFVGTSRGLMLFNRGLEEKYIQSLFSQFPQGFCSEKKLSQLETIQDTSIVLGLSPLRFSSDYLLSNIYFSKIVSNCTFNGNCGKLVRTSLSNPIRYLSYIPEIIPFFHIAAVGQPKENAKLLELGLSAFYNWLRSYSFCCTDKQRYIKESKLFLDCFGYLTQFLHPELVDIKIMKLLSEIMQDHESLSLIVFSTLLNTLNFWINIGDIPSALFWENIKCFYAINKAQYEKYINPTQLLLIMETMSESSDNKCCSVISSSNCELNIRYTFIINIIKSMTIDNPEISQRLMLQTVLIMERKPSHCFFLSIVELLKGLCENNPIYLKYLNNVNGFFTLCNIAAEY